MKSLLESVIDAYLANEPAERLIDCCFVFPNKRTGVFFHNIISEKFKAAGKISLHPSSLPVNEFIASLADGIQVDRLEAIFILYNAYRDVVNERTGGKGHVDFNKFQRWGDVLMSDFNDVDMSLVDPSELFPNLEGLREISANYLTEQQLRAIERYWDKEKIPEEVTGFWNHISHTLHEPGRKPSVEFVKLWQVMQQVYQEYRRRLAEKGLYYMGMAYREVMAKLKGMSADELPYRRYVFVGFSLLTPVEKKIFGILRDKYTPDGVPLADFYWDNASPAFDMEGNTGAFINRMAGEFPSLYDCVEKLTSFPRISIIGIPSRVGQAKLTGEIVSRLSYKLLPPAADSISGTDAESDNEMSSRQKEEEEQRASILRRIAVVLPDEALATPVLRSIPEAVNPVNLTMGYKLRQSAAATFVSAVVRMQMRGRLSMRDGRGRFLAEDVLQVLALPIVHEGAPQAATRATLEIRLKRSFTVDADFFDTEDLKELAPVFCFVSNADDPDAVLSYLERLLRWTVDKLTETGGTATTELPPDEVFQLYDLDGTPLTPVSKATPRVVDLAIAQRYFDAITHLRHLSGEYLGADRIYLADNTVFRMIEKLVAGETLSFQGKPLRGLQLMGVLEARALDFEYMVIPSLNEKIFPRRHYQKSLIPPVLRKAYGMVTTEHQEALYSYYFYRMIARAKRVWLIYDARRGTRSGGRMSRYLHQLIRLYRPAGLQRSLHGYPVHTPPKHNLEVKKTPEIMARIRRYFTDKEDEAAYLSASSINEYINCPLCFYLKNIEGYKREDTITEWIDEGTFGTVMHEAFEVLMEEIARRNPGRMITAEAIDSILSSPIKIERAVTRAINRHHHNLGKENDTPLEGSSLIVGQLIVQYVEMTLKRDRALTPFRYIAGEKRFTHRLTLRDTDEASGEQLDSVTFNLMAVIDRIDEVTHPLDSTGHLKRIVDYKTGADPVEAKSVKSLFEPPANEREVRPKAMLQLLLYAQAYQEHLGTDEPLQPLIYSLRKVSTQPFKPLKIGEEEVYDHRKFISEMNRYLIPFIKELFDENEPFRNTTDIRACHYCKFQDICSRKPE